MRKIKYHFTLIEVLIYLAVFAVVTGLGLSLFYKGMKHSRHFRKASGDILRISRIGDNWRKRVRNANNIKLTDSVLTLTPAKGEPVYYQFKDHAINFRPDSKSPWRTLMKSIKSCTFKEEKDSGVNVWKMNVELQTRAKNAKVKPLFTFISVNRKNVAQASSATCSAEQQKAE